MLEICRRLLLLLPVIVLAGAVPAPAPQANPDAMRTAMNVPQAPFRIFGNSFYVGTRGLSVILVTSDAGHILIDGALAESAPQVVANIRKLGFKPEDVKLILSTHAHYDHAGGLAELAKLSGALVAASPWTAKVLEAGKAPPDDPQFGALPAFPPVTPVLAVADGETMRVGPLAVTARFTPGHTPGGTSWTWQSCDPENAARCLNVVYADSLTPVSANGFLFSRGGAYPNALIDFEKSFHLLEGLPCDILLTPHPEASDLLGKLARREQGGGEDPFVDPAACRKLVAGAREMLARRLAQENTRRP